MALAMGKWGCWLAVAVHVVVGGKEAMRFCPLQRTNIGASVTENIKISHIDGVDHCSPCESWSRGLKLNCCAIVISEGSLNGIHAGLEALRDFFT